MVWFGSAIAGSVMGVWDAVQIVKSNGVPFPQILLVCSRVLLLQPYSVLPPAKTETVDGSAFEQPAVHEEMVRVERELAHMQPFQPTQLEFGENRSLADHPLPDVHEDELSE